MLQLLLIIICLFSFQPSGHSAMCIKESDGSPDNCYWQMIVQNGTLTDNGDATASFDPSGGTGGDNVTIDSASVVDPDFASTGDIDFVLTGSTVTANYNAGSILNADVNASAGIALSKLASMTASKAVVSDASGFLTPSAVTSTELGYLSGVTSAIQTQLDGKQASGSYLTSESDPTVDTSAEIQAIIGASVYQPYDADLTTWAGVTPASGVATFLATPSSANLIAAVTNESGTGALLFGTSPTISTPALTLATTSSTTAGRLFRNASNYLQMGNGSSTESFYPAGTVTNGNLCTYDSAGFEFDCNTPTSTFLTDSSTATLTNKTFNAVGTGNSITNIPSSGINWTDIDAQEIQRAGINWSSLTNDIQRGGINWSSLTNDVKLTGINWDSFWVDSASGINWGTIPGSTVGYVLKKTTSGINWQADLTGEGGGDEVSINSVAVTNPDFVSTGQVSFTDTSNTITANVTNDSLLEVDLKAVDSASDEDILTYESTTGDFEWHTISEMIALMSQGALPNDSVVEADLKAVDSPNDEECLTYETTTGDFEWQSCGNGSGGAKIIQLNPYSAKLTGAYVTATITSVTTATQGAQIDAGDGNWRVLFDATTDEAAVFYGIVPDNYTSTPVIKLMYSMVSATTGEVEWEGAVMCVTPGDAADIGTASFAAGAASVETVPGTAGHTDTLVSITPTDDSCAAGDLIYVWISTDAGDAGGNDDATGDRELVGAYVSYT